MALRGTFGPRMIVWQHAADHHRAENLQHHTIPAGDAVWSPHAGVMTKSAGQRDKVSASSPIASVVDKAGNIHEPISNHRRNGAVVVTYWTARLDKLLWRES